MTADVTVLIPTRKRPHYLRNALKSVARQIGRECIKCVRVMENSTDERSRSVCAEFSSELPIEYIFRNTETLSFFGHFKTYLAEEYSTPFVAMLHDDDWWLPSHLASSLDSIRRLGAVASYSNFFETENETTQLQADANLLFALSKGFAPTTEEWALSLSDVLVGSLAGTPGRYSAMVVGTELFKSITPILAEANICDNDRMLPPFYAKSGIVAYNPVPTVCIRRHSEQDQARFKPEDIVRWNAETTVWFFKLAKEAGVDVLQELNDRITRCPPQFLSVSLERLTRPWLYILLRNNSRIHPLLLKEWTRIELARRAGGNAAAQPAHAQP